MTVVIKRHYACMHVFYFHAHMHEHTYMHDAGTCDLHVPLNLFCGCCN